RGLLMMRCSRSLLAFALLMTVTIPSQAADQPASLFPDQNLEAAVRDVLKKSDKDALAEADLKNVYILKAQDSKIADLTGLEKCTNLAELNLAQNEIKDLKPLGELKNLQSLDLSN